MPPKRRRNKGDASASTASPAAAAAASAATTDEATPTTTTTTLWMETLLHETLQLSRDKSRCSDSLQALIDHKSDWLLGNDASQQHQSVRDVQWIMLQTHAIYRLVALLLAQHPPPTKPESSSSSSTTSATTTTTTLQHHIAMVLGVQCHTLAQTLTSCDNKSRLDKCSHAPGGKMLLGRALTSCAVGARHALVWLVVIVRPAGKPPRKHSMPHLRRALQCTLWALDMTIHHANIQNHSNNNNNNNNNNNKGTLEALASLSHDVSLLQVQGEEFWEEVCRSVTEALEITDVEQACLQVLLNQETNTTNSSGSKPAAAVAKDTTGRRRASTTAAAAASSSSSSSPFWQLREDHPVHSMELEGRVALRRWASMAFVWLGQGQEVALQVAHSLLTHAPYWNAVLDLPAAERTAPTEISASAASKRSKKKIKKTNKRDRDKEPEEEQDKPQPSKFASVPGHVATVACASRLVDVVSESGNNCGPRPPTGGLDTFVAALVGPQTTTATTKRGGKRGSSSASSSSTTMTRGNHIGEYASVVMHELIVAHRACFEEEHNNIGDRMVNDELEEGAAVWEGRARFYPFVHKSLEALCRAAASACNDLAPNRFLGLAAGLVFQDGPLQDARLVNFAVHLLQGWLRNMTHEEENRRSSSNIASGDASQQDAVEEETSAAEFGYDVALVVPSLPTTTRKGGRKKKTQNESTFDSTFGGLYSHAQNSQSSIPWEEMVRLFVRAMVSSEDDDNEEKNPMTRLLERLVEVVRNCYNVNSNGQNNNNNKAPSKRPARGKGGSRKRRKLASGGKEVVATEDASVSGDDAKRQELRRITSIRAGLATDALHALRMFATHPQRSASISSTHSRLARYWHGSFSTSILCDVVVLNRMLADVMIEGPQGSRVKQKGLSEPSVASSFFSTSDSFDFRHFETSVWTTHIGLCQALGRGRGKSLADSSTQPGMLTDASRRLEVLKAVASEPARARPGIHSPPCEPDRWPLFLPSPQHALIMSCLASLPLSSDINETKPEAFVIHAFLSSIEDALGDLSTVTQGKWYSSSSMSEDDYFSDDDVPLSIRDAQLFVLAFSRLPKKNQNACLLKFVKALSSTLNYAKTDEATRSLIESHAEVSGFLARLITLCTTLVHFVIVGERLRERFCSEIYNAHFGLRIPVSRKDISQGTRCYTREAAFMGLFGDWESPRLPEVVLPPQLGALDTQIRSKLDALLETGLELGFASMPRDKGHLFFASWTASGSSASWDPATNAIPRLDETRVSVEDLPRRLIEMRDDVSVLCRHLHAQTGVESRSLLRSIVLRRFPGTRWGTQTLQSVLAAMMTKAEVMVEKLLVDASQANGKVHPIVFSTLSALSCYISFIVSMHTRPISDYFAGMGSSRRNASSSAIHSDDDSVEVDNDDDEYIDEMANFHDSCDLFGAAPIYPDWLSEQECRWAHGITSADAQAIAERALACLSKLSSAAHRQRVRAYREGLSIGKSPGDFLVDVAVRLCIGLEAAGYPSEEEKEGRDDLCSAVASVCGIEDKVIKRFSNGTSNMDAEDTWLPNSAQRVFGRLQRVQDAIGDITFCEYRATGEWELLMTDSLLCSRVFVDSKDEEGPAERLHDIFVTAERWKILCDASLSNLMPASALLRFSLANGRGRMLHPLNKRAADPQEHDSSPVSLLHFDEKAEGAYSHDEDVVKNTVSKCLSTLAQISGMATHGIYVKRLCHAVAANLMVNSKKMIDLEVMEMFRFVFETLVKLRLMRNESSRSKECAAIIATLITTIDTEGVPVDYDTARGAVDSSSRPLPSCYSLLFSYLSGTPTTCQPIGMGNVEVFALLSGSDALDEDENKRPVWDWNQPHEKSVAALVEILFSSSLKLPDERRRTLACMLSILAKYDYEKSQAGIQCPRILPAVVDAFNGLGDDAVSALMRSLIRIKPSDDSGGEESQALLLENISVLIVYTVAESPTNDKKHDGSWWELRLIETLVQEFHKLESVNLALDHVLCLLLLLGCRHGVLSTVGSSVLNTLSSKFGTEETCLKRIEKFFRFARELKERIADDGRGDPLSIEPFASSPGECPPDQHALSSEEGASSADQPTDTDRSDPHACSFIVKSGFHNQHWYNCYTCGLVWDKGCCTLCALKCHAGHDLSYSRYSSFFCDCGGEAQSADTPNRVACKCLSALDPAEVQELFEKEKFALLDGEARSTSARETSETGGMTSKQRHDDSLFSIVLQVAASKLKSFSSASLRELEKVASEESWMAPLFDKLQEECKRWEGRTNENVYREVKHAERHGKAPDTSLDEYLKENILTHFGKSTEVVSIVGRALIPVRSARTNAFNLKLSSDGTTDRLKRAMLAKHKVKRRALVADSRGRLVIAEPCSLLFCSVLPLVNTTGIDDTRSGSQLSRSQMNILGSESIRFNIVGMQFCRENERHLVVWGTTEARIVVLSKMCDKVEKSIDLELVLDPHECEADYLLKCEWVPGSQTALVLACGSFIRIYDIQDWGHSSQSLPSVAFYTFDFDGLVRDMALVPAVSSAFTSQVSESRRDVSCILLLDSGNMHSVNLEFDSEGELVQRGELYYEPSEGTPFSTTGFRSAHPGPTAFSLGEGATLEYLPKSGLLLYQCASSHVVAMRWRSEGTIEQTFELLPPMLNSQLLKQGPDGYNVTGPFTHWTDLGIVQGSGEAFYRAVCVGRSSRTTQPKLICVDFNENSVRVKELTFGSMGLGLSLSTSFEGLAAFSAPVVHYDRESTNISDFERSCLAVCTSNGAMLVFGEELPNAFTPLSTGPGAHVPPSPRRRALSDSVLIRPTTSRAAVTSLANAKEIAKKFPLTLFEHLENASDSGKLILGGDGVGSDRDSAKAKLSAKNSLYLMCPSRDGCTITAALPFPDSRKDTPQVDVSENEGRSLDYMQKQKVIVALRILVGSTTTEFIPKYVTVEGRRMELTPRMKRWYDLPLTAEEIALALRNGFVCLGIGPSFDPGNNSLVDALNVYVKERRYVDHWIPKEPHCKVSVVSGTQLFQDDAEIPEADRSGNLGLLLTTDSLAHLFRIVGSAGLHSIGKWSEILEEIIQVSTLDKDVRQSVTRLLEGLESDPGVRQKLMDDATISGLSNLLQKMEGQVQQGHSRSSDGRSPTDAIGGPGSPSRLLILLGEIMKCAATICVARPENYMTANDDLIGDGANFASSIALRSINLSEQAKSEGNNREIGEFIADTVELCLAEMAFGSTSTRSFKGRFAKFDSIASLLVSERSEIVDNCCRTISSFVERNLAVESAVGGPVLVDSPNAEMGENYRYICDGCSRFPIKDIRFSLSESDVDLCQDCYENALDLAKKSGFSSDILVKLGGKPIGSNVMLNCANVKHMEKLPIVENVSPGQDGGSDKSGKGNDRNEKPSESHTSGTDAVDGNTLSVDYTKFVHDLFTNILQMMRSWLSSHQSTTPGKRVERVVNLLLDIIKACSSKEIQMALAEQFAREITGEISNQIESCNSSDEPAMDLLTDCLASLASLVGVSSSVEAVDMQGLDGTADTLTLSTNLPSPKAKGKTDPRFVCASHGVPAVRRRCSHGTHKNRRFYVCGMDRDSRCKYFKWADEDVTSNAASPTREKLGLAFDMSPLLWSLFQLPSKRNPLVPLHVQLCQLLEKSACVAGCVPAIPNAGAQASRTGGASSAPRAVYGRAEALNDYLDGVFSSRDKLGFGTSRLRFKSEDHQGFRDTHTAHIPASKKGEMLVEVSLGLIARIAAREMSPEAVSENREYSRWFSLLCEVISSQKMSGRVRAEAKSTLKRLCGGRREVYLRVRDHYVFAIQFRNMLQEMQQQVLGALTAAQKARECGTRWNDGTRLGWSQLGAGGLISTRDLVSEDCLTLSGKRLVGTALSELLKVAKARGGNWRRFCALSGLPSSHRGQDAANALSLGLSNSSPLVALWWAASCFSGSNYAKILRLIAFALDISHGGAANAVASAHPSIVEEDNCMSSEGEFETNAGVVTDDVARTSSPEEILLRGPKALSTQEIFWFIAQFVLCGPNVDLRKIAGQVAIKLCEGLSSSDFQWVFEAAIRYTLEKIPEMGSTCNQSLQMLQSMVRETQETSFQSTAIAEFVVSFFVKQMQSLKYVLTGNADNILVLEVSGNGGETTTRKQYDMSCCVHCHRAQINAIKASTGRQVTVEPQSASENRPTRSSNRDSRGTESSRSTKWLRDQFRPYRKSRLEASVDDFVSSDFANFYQLKRRLAVSEIAVSVTDARGRYVKTIAFYISPRQVSDVNELKSAEYESTWQRCGTLSLSRGASRGTCLLSEPVAAANLKIEYLDFYERPGGSHAPDGSLLVHCPRCTRVVNNAHGVCGNCGEVAFQCRKCRHINYDRMEAFLCVECGYCSAGSFAYEITAGVVSSAVAILDDESCERSKNVLRAATQLHHELENALKEKIRTCTLKRSHPDDSSALVGFTPALKRAYYGKLPLLSGSADQSRASTGSSSRTAARAPQDGGSSNRTRSLLRLARQLRSDSSEGSSGGDAIVRHAFFGRDLSVDEIDIIDSVEGGILAAGGLDGSDPLSRIIASIQRSRSSREQSSSSAPRSGGGANREPGAAGPAAAASIGPGRSQSNSHETGTSSGSNNANNNANDATGRSRSNSETSPKAVLEECDKLYQLMRETERECFELRRRIQAWQRLEHDALVETPELNASMRPTSCTKCSGPVTLNLLVLVMKLIQSDSAILESVVTKRFLGALFEEPPKLDKELREVKRLAITTIAQKSKRGSKLVLEELERRLKASRDSTSAEILGKLLKKDVGELDDEYVRLATETLGS